MIAGLSESPCSHRLGI